MLRNGTRWIWALSCGFSLLVVSSVPSAAQEPDQKSAEYYELMQVFADTFEQIDRNYVKDVDRRQLLEAAIDGMLSELDQYSSYISPDDLVRFNQSVEQEFGGIGVQVHIDPETKRLTVMTPLPGTPAYKAGVRAGDVIMEIEGESTEGYTIADAVKRLKGKPGEEVTIGVKHVGSEEIEQIGIVRDVIHVATVLGDRYNSDSTWNFWLDEENKIAYIRLTHFSRHSIEELKQALTKLEKTGLRGLILDLRFNPGGLLSQATGVADLFIESGKIVSTEGRNTRKRVWNAQKQGTFTGFPMAVLVNRYSASASEIVGACLQDHDRAVIVGERTWGKGSVQNVIKLEQGDSALKLTTASYHRPSGKNIHRFPDSQESDEWGVMPDEGYRLRLSEEELQQYLEYRRERDVLTKEGPPESDFEDRQLNKAIEYIREQLGLAKPQATEKKPEAEGDSAEAAGAPRGEQGSPAAADARPSRIRILRKAAA